MKKAAPPDTEALHPRGEDLDQATLREVVFRMHQEDRVAVEAVGRVLPSVAEAAHAAAQAIGSGGRLIYVGAGTSGRLGVLDAAECPPTFGTSPDQVVAMLAGGPEAFSRAIEGAEDDSDLGARQLRALRPTPKDVVVGISASGQTPFVQGALGAARRAGATTVMIACSRTADVHLADISVLPQTGPELVAGSTRLKAGTATKLILNAISTAAMVAAGKVYRGRMVELAPSNAKLRARAVRMVAELLDLDEAKAGKLLQRAGGQPRVALAMHWTGLDRAGAEKQLRAHSLRELAKRSRT